MTIIAGPLALAQGRPRPSLETCAGFLTNDDVGVELLTLQADYPDIVRAFSIGASISDRELWAVLISADPDAETAEPEVRIIGGIHGDECMSVEIVVQVAQWLAEDYGVDPDTTALIDESQVILVPSINPDGRARAWASRTNAADVDLNRNLGFAWVDAGGMFGEGPHPFSEPETRALRDLSQQQSFVLGITYHTRADIVNGPWNYTPNRTDDEALIAAIGDAYAGDSGYTASFGWDWYTINGDVNDWSLGTRGTFDWTIELRRDRSMEWGVHQESLRRFLAFVHRGVHGVVTDARTGEPIAARIEVEPGAAPAFADVAVGDYHRVLLEGTYDVTAMAQGYDSSTVTNVIVPADGEVEVDFALDPSPDGSLEYGFAINQMELPESVANEIYEDIDYLNNTSPWDALGPPDALYYSMSPGGSLTVDLGEGHEVLDAEGDDLELVSGTLSDDPATVLVGSDQDGPFVEVGAGEGTFSVDIGAAGLTEARYVKVVDHGDGPFNDAQAGYDLDAVVNHSPRPRPDVGPDADADVDADLDGDVVTDGGVDAGPDVDADVDRGVVDSGPSIDAGDAAADAGRTDGDIAVVDRHERGCGCRAITSRRTVAWKILVGM